MEYRCRRVQSLHSLEKVGELEFNIMLIFWLYESTPTSVGLLRLRLFTHSRTKHLSAGGRSLRVGTPRGIGPELALLVLVVLVASRKRKMRANQILTQDFYMIL